MRRDFLLAVLIFVALWSNCEGSEREDTQLKGSVLMTGAALTLKTAIGSYPHHEALKRASEASADFQLDHVEVTPIIAAFRRMCRDQEFDVCEMAITTYLTARRYGLPFTAIPIFPVRLVAHDAITCNTTTGVYEPRDIEGKAVAVRAYTVTTGVWVRGILASEYGVDLNKVTWVLADEEHVRAFEKDAPANTDYRVGADIVQLLSNAEVCAAIGAGPPALPTIRPLIHDPAAAARRLFEETGIYPINHTIVIKNSIIEANPWLPAALFFAFKAAKEQWLARASDDEKQVIGTGIYIDDPVPYGLEANRKALETVIRYANEQQIIPRYRLEEVFESSTIGLS